MLGYAAGPTTNAQTVRAIVAADGSGDFSTIQRAVDHVLDRPPASVERVILEIRPGVYRERVKIPQDRPNLTLIGQRRRDNADHLPDERQGCWSTFFSPITEIDGAGFEAVNIAFENLFWGRLTAVALSFTPTALFFATAGFWLAGYALCCVGAPVIIAIA